MNVFLFGKKFGKEQVSEIDIRVGVIEIFFSRPILTD